MPSNYDTNVSAGQRISLSHEPSSVNAIDRVQFVQFCIQYASITLVFYDYLLTWTREVKYIWRKKFTLSTALYIACRYSMISNVLFVFARAGKLAPAISCDAGYQICCSFSVLGRAAVLIVLGARTYAIFDRKKWILVIFVPLGTSIVVIDAMHIKYVVCVGSPKNGSPEEFMAISVVVYEVLAAIFTVFRGWQALRIRVDITSGKDRLEYLVVQQGKCTYCFVSLFTMSTLIMLHVAPSGSFLQRLFNALTLPVSGMMTARFILHLREWEHSRTMASMGTAIDSIEFQIPRLSTVAHASVCSERTSESSSLDEEREDDIAEVPRSSRTSLYSDGGSRGVIDEFGRCLVRQAKIERKNIPSDIEEV
ncbi:hypothetical protein JR316_0001298 [Psilocybe cubensis]|uniref:Uncharacterized protein n=1 Tax=Psilocybe cubensis TaxID=181762 RepID=A0ACB8HHQ8_PSICU|nr:hypothetical protein JR316_0001298 [Psilocybe cubensis]KAH9487229.1 hypothetical protein JR316_0001298 [Psilocybe cubensis]